MQGLVEFAFAASLRSFKKTLKVRWMPESSERFLEGNLLLERFAFRVAAATFAWSKKDWSTAGMPKPGRTPRSRRLRRHLHHKKLAQGQTRFRASCLQRDASTTSCVGMLPQCVLVLHPVRSSTMMRDMQQIVPRTTCLAAVDLRTREGVPLVSPTSKNPQEIGEGMKGWLHGLRATVRRGQLYMLGSKWTQPGTPRRSDTLIAL